jgi:asparagine synthase (glutamine-hydrolysing)
MNWPYIETFVRYGDISGTATPFDNINELPMGCMLNKKRFSASVICEPEWNPVKYVNSAFDSRDWIEEFSKRIGHSINTHTSDIFIELSGGLDSALMSAMLQCTKFANVYAINLYNQDDFQSNETDYAKFVAAHLGLQLDFLETSSALPFTPVGFDRKPDKPQTTWSHMAELKLIIEYIRARSDDYTILHGFGGDSMMHQTPSHDFVIDALLCAGFKKARKTALLLSDYYSKSYLYNMFQYLRILKSYLLKKKLFLYFNAPVNSWQKQYSHDLFQFLHPYLQVLKHQKVIPGKAHQIEEFFYSLASISPKEHRYYPYLTKEVFEIALKMPAYQTFNNQYNRIHQREMLRALIGENISMRKTKGHATQTFFKGFQKNIRAVEAYCLEGRLVKEGIVDKKILEKNISIAYHGVMEKIWGIKNLYCAEIFLSEWEK